MTTVHEWLARMISDLESAGYEPVVQPALGGLRPDLLVPLKNGHEVVIEVKRWSGTEGSIDRARNQGRYLQDVLGTDHALVAIPGIGNSAVSSVVDVEQLLGAIQSLENAPSRPRRSKVTDGEFVPDMFCAMPFEASFDDVFFVAMAGAAEALGFAARRVDQEHFADDIVKEVHDLISSAQILVADLSGSNPNVMYEVGYARGLGKPVIAVSSTVENQAFNLAHFNTISYIPGRTHNLRGDLEARIRSLAS